MADPLSSSPVTPETQPGGTSESVQPDLQSISSDPSHPSPVPSSSLIPPSSSAISYTPVAETPNSNPPIITPPPPSVQSFAPSSIVPGAILPSAPSFRPVLPTPQFSPPPNPNFLNPNIQNPNVQPPGVNPVSIMLPGASGASGAGSVMVSVSPLRPTGIYQAPPGVPPTSAMRSYPQMPNGFPTAPSTTPQGMVHPPGIPRFPTPYPAMVRPPFPPRPPGVIGVVPPLSCPPIPGIRPPIVPIVVRPVVSIVPPTEKPQTTVYVGKIAATVENHFMLSLLRLCGDVKSWKRAQDPSDGTPRGFGFCEFESAEGVLRALRLLSKFNVDGQELVFNVNQATREYLERYVEKKTEREKKPKETENEDTEKEQESQPGSEKSKLQKTSEEHLKKDENDSADKENQDNSSFGIVTDEDREADRDALEKLKSMIEERIKTKPPPPPPALTTADSSAKSNSEVPSKSRDEDSDVDIMKDDAAEDKNDDETTSENKPSNEHDKSETSSPGRRRYDRHSRDRDRERDLKREKERELERYERERERERVRRERQQELKIREAERLFKERVKEWEAREREKEHQRHNEKEREKERERERRREIRDQEVESDDDDTRKRRHRSSAYEEKRKKRQREKEDDLADRLREEEEIAEAKRRAIEELQMQKDEPKVEVANGVERSSMREESITEQAYESDSGHVNHASDMILDFSNGVTDESTTVAVSDMRQSNNAPARKLGFGLVGSGKRTTAPSVFHEEDDDDAEKEKKMRPLVPLDYSTDELQVAQPAVSGAPSPNLAAAAEFAKRISNANPKEDKFDADKEKNRRSTDKLSHRDRDRINDDNNRARDENREKKLLDAKQLIDMIPKTKEELFSYKINWAVYDKHELHERMRPWISKKITEFLGEEEETLVDYIVSSTKQHVQASQMLDLLHNILDDEAEMFVLKMWRMLIFEIKKQH
ncbi:RNA-binding protein 25-like isoform X2 [Macadamia integrifolia]|uniref:RNA-binding protein 25-like isoform X2 n=1 Tax=Macadamia integrifolia TaxID=60698 RepID=UPI001C50003C|nr:RNA-binding protein 25-like isoform X2 [Macadamia integrifolia]